MVYESELKIAKVVPVLKSGDPSLFTIDKPISVLPFLSKLCIIVCLTS